MVISELFTSPCFKRETIFCNFPFSSEFTFHTFCYFLLDKKFKNLVNCLPWINGSLHMDEILWTQISFSINISCLLQLNHSFSQPHRFIPSGAIWSDLGLPCLMRLIVQIFIWLSEANNILTPCHAEYLLCTTLLPNFYPVNLQCSSNQQEFSRIENSVGPNQIASLEASWSGSNVFSITNKSRFSRTRVNLS